jgi:hypothetical protein
MKLSIKTAFAATLSAALAATALVAVGQGASAYTGNPPWVAGDTQAKGGVAFYDAPGNVLSGGSDYNHLAAYFGGTSAYRTGATKAAVSIAFPQSGIANPANWLTQSFQLSTTFIPAPSGTPASIPVANPFVKIATVASPTPMDDALGNNAVPDTSTAYNNTFEVRIQDSGTSVVADGGKYWRAVVEYNPVGSGIASYNGLAEGAWRLVYPAAVAAPTSTTLAVSPASPVTNSTSVTLTSTSTAGVAGSVAFDVDGVAFGAPKSPDASGIAVSDAGTLAGGTHTLHAVFTPSAPAANQAGYAASTGTITNYVVSIPTFPTVTNLTVDNASVTKPAAITGSAIVTDAGATVTTGSVDFQIDGVSVGIDLSSPFTFSAPSTGFSEASHNVVAIFTPVTNAAHQLETSTSATGTVTVLAATCVNLTATGSNIGTTTPLADCQGIQTQINPGVITITTPYIDTKGIPCATDAAGNVTAAAAATCGKLVLPAMTLDSTTTGYTTSATFRNISVLDERPGNLPWTLSAGASNLTRVGGDAGYANGSVFEIDGHNVGLTGLASSTTPVVVNGVTYPVGALNNTNGTLTPYNNAAALWLQPGASAGGLGGAAGAIILHNSNGRGTTTVDGLLTINAPTNTQDGKYLGTITFTVIGS